MPFTPRDWREAWYWSSLDYEKGRQDGRAGYNSTGRAFWDSSAYKLGQNEGAMLRRMSDIGQKPNERNW